MPKPATAQNNPLLASPEETIWRSVQKKLMTMQMKDE